VAGVEITAKIGKKNYRVDVAAPHDISIPVRFDEKQISAFGAPPATKQPFKNEGFVGAVTHGGSCNCDMLQFSPHLHGTHTECVGHIAKAAISVHDILKDSLIPATLISVSPMADDSIAKAEFAGLSNKDFLAALIVRTKPNDATKMTARYHSAPFFSVEAMQYITDLGVKHLLVDFPSIDRMEDEGKLVNHRIFWDVAPGSHEIKTPSSKTVTELVYAPNEVKDGYYMLNLQLAAFAADAAPSRPLLYPVEAL
jgi:arylformamidase